MRRGRLLILLALILLGIALAAWFLIGGGGGGDDGEVILAQPTPVPFEDNIIIAAQNIPRGAVIPNDGVIIAPFPLDMVVETMATDVGQVVGRLRAVRSAVHGSHLVPCAHGVKGLGMAR